MHFVDTNVLVYARDDADPRKRDRARMIMARLWQGGDGRLSQQVLIEFYSTVTRKLKPGLPREEAIADVRELSVWNPIRPSLPLFDQAWQLEERYGFSWWDSLIVAAAPVPPPRPEDLIAAAPEGTPGALKLEVVTRVSTAGGRHYGINVGKYASQYEAERVLLKTALVEISTLDEALRKVVSRSGGYEANFVGMTEDMAQLACRRLEARRMSCTTLGPS